MKNFPNEMESIMKGLPSDKLFFAYENGKDVTENYGKLEGDVESSKALIVNNVTIKKLLSKYKKQIDNLSNEV